MVFKVLRGFPVATERSRPGASIGEVRFDIRSDETSQKPLQSGDKCYIFRAKNLKKYKNIDYRSPFKRGKKNSLNVGVRTSDGIRFEYRPVAGVPPAEVPKRFAALLAWGAARSGA